MGATLLYWLGAEHTIVKYGRVFSAFQFLLSTESEQYAQGVSLMLRYVIAFATSAADWRQFNGFPGGCFVTQLQMLNG